MSKPERKRSKWSRASRVAASQRMKLAWRRKKAEREAVRQVEARRNIVDAHLVDDNIESGTRERQLHFLCNAMWNGLTVEQKIDMLTHHLMTAPE